MDQTANLGRICALAVSLAIASVHAQEGGNSTPQAQPSTSEAKVARGSLAPVETHTWIRIHRWDRMQAQLDGHPLQVVLKNLHDHGGRLARAAQSLEAVTTDFANAQGLSQKVLADLLGRDTRISLFGRASQEFLFALDTGEHTPLIQHMIDAAPEVDGEAGMHTLQHSFGGRETSIVYLEGKRLWVCSSVESAKVARSLESGEGKSLRDTPAFQTTALGKQHDGNTWLSVFVKPVTADKAWRTEGSAPESGLASSLLTFEALAWHSTFADGNLTDEIYAALPEQGAQGFAFAGKTNPDDKLARLVPPGTTTWFAAKVSPAEFVRFCARNGYAVAGIDGLGILDVKNTDNSDGNPFETLLGTEVLALGGNGQTPGGLIVSLQDSFRTKALLESTAKKIEIPGEEQGIHQFRLEREGTTIQIALCDDYLLISSDPKFMSSMLEQYLSGQAAADVAQAFANAKGHWLIGSEDPKLRIHDADSLGQHGLKSTGDHFDLTSIVAKRDGHKITFRAHGKTGAAHLAMLGFDATIPVLLESWQTRKQKSITGILDRLHNGQVTFIAQHHEDRDEDGSGEAGQVPQLIETGAFALPESGTVDGDRLEVLGYRFRVLRPEDITLAEGHSLAIAWPTRPGITGRRCFLVQRNGSLWSHSWIAGLDPEQGPTLSHVFEGKAWSSQLHPAWEPLRSAEEVVVAHDTEQNTEKPGLTELDIARAQLDIDAAHGRMDAGTVQRFLDHPDARIQARAAHRLGDLKDTPSVPALARLLKGSEHAIVRQRAARALAMIGDPKGLATLVEVTNDDDAHVRYFAASGLQGKNLPGVKKGLIEGIHGNPNEAVGERTQAVLTLTDLGDASVLNELASAKSSGPKFEQALVFCFQALSPKLKEAEPDLLIRALASPIRPLRAYAIQRLGASGRAEALPTLISRLSEEEPSLQPALRLSIDALTPSAQPGVGAFMGDIKKSSNELWLKFKKQPKWLQLAIALTPIVLMMLLMLFLWSRRRSTYVEPVSQSALSGLPDDPGDPDAMMSAEFDLESVNFSGPALDESVEFSSPVFEETEADEQAYSS